MTAKGADGHMLDIGNGLDGEVELLHRLNDAGAGLPEPAKAVVNAVGEWGLLLALTLLVGVAWRTVRGRPRAVAAVAGVLWTPLAAGLAYLVNMPLRNLVARPRPSVTEPGVTALVDDVTGYAFVSDHAAVAMAVAVVLFLVHRAIGAVALVLAVLQGLAQVVMGLHYPTDVVGGFALGTAVALLLAPLALAALTPSVALCSRTRWAAWVARPSQRDDEPEDEPGEGRDQPDEADEAGARTGPRSGLAA